MADSKEPMACLKQVGVTQDNRTEFFDELLRSTNKLNSENIKNLGIINESDWKSLDQLPKEEDLENKYYYETNKDGTYYVFVFDIDNSAPLDKKLKYLWDYVGGKEVDEPKDIIELKNSEIFPYLFTTKEEIKKGNRAPAQSQVSQGNQGIGGPGPSTNQASSGNYKDIGIPDDENVVINFKFPKGNPFNTIRDTMSKEIMIFERNAFNNKFNNDKDISILSDIFKKINHPRDPFLPDEDKAKLHFSKRSLLIPLIRLKMRDNIYNYDPFGLGEDGNGKKVTKNIDSGLIVKKASDNYYRAMTNDIEKNQVYGLNQHLMAMKYKEHVNYIQSPEDDDTYSNFKPPGLPYLSSNINSEERNHPQYTFLAPIFDYFSKYGFLSRVYYPRLYKKEDADLATEYAEIKEQMKWEIKTVSGLKKEEKDKITAEIKELFNKSNDDLIKTFGLSFIDLIVKIALLILANEDTYLNDTIISGKNIPTLETFNKGETKFSIQINKDKFKYAFGLYPVFKALVKNNKINYGRNLEISIDPAQNEKLKNLTNAIVTNNSKYMDKSLKIVSSSTNPSAGGRRRTRRKSRKSRRRSQKNNRRRSRRRSQKNNRRRSRK